jgi:hypothetical protein
MTLFRQRFDAYVTRGRIRSTRRDKNDSTSSHDFLLSRATMAPMMLTRKLKWVTSTRRVHKHCKATSSKPDFAAKSNVSILQRQGR